MKKFFTVLIMIGVLGLVGCGKKEEITINKDIKNHKEQIKERLTGNSIGIYNVNNLEKGLYKVSISSQEYNDGKLKASNEILVGEIEIKNIDEILNIGINKNDEEVLVFDISKNGEDGFTAFTSQGMDLSKYQKNEGGSSWNMLENDPEGMHKIQLGKDFAIASFSIEKDGVTYGINLGNNFVNPSDIENNMVDIIIYLKISKI